MRDQGASRERSCSGDGDARSGGTGGINSGRKAAPKHRPGSAQPRPGPPSAPAPPVAQAIRSASADPKRYLASLQAQCTELKCAANNATEENMRARTRLMALERELQKRDRLLQPLLQLKQAGMGVGLDVIEKLREERNMLPIFRRKAQDLQAQLDERDADIKRMKIAPNFTRVIELQVEFASWQHEMRRLDSLLKDPSPESNPASQKEAEVHVQRSAKLEGDLAALEKHRDSLVDEVAEVEADHSSWQDTYHEKEAELVRQQDATRDLAVAFKDLLQRRREAEEVQDDIDKMALSQRQASQELAALTPNCKTVAELAAENMAVAPAEGLDGCTVSGAALSCEFSSSALARGWLLRQAALRSSGSEASLFACLQGRDQDADGLLSASELVQAIGDWRSCPLDVTEEAAAVVSAMLPVSERTDGSVRWLDLLVRLECLAGSLSSSSKAPRLELPDVRPLRWACLRGGISREEFHRRLLAVSSLQSARALFLGDGDGGGSSEQSVGLVASHGASWVAAWQDLGTQQLLLLLPLSETARSASALKAWQARCISALRAHEKELVEAFTVWRADMMLTEEQFHMVCIDVMGAKLSEEDIEDLRLLAGPPDSVTSSAAAFSGSAVLQLLKQ
ncbi:unnamed protein product [Polarella glacialis]|uniref:EF-hand domain-containing protein n=1 Tax=Polarella glacialis TaxID=89957 RepID=A0A813JTA8_POLGL|nr:unnamed protein product [Polarella glacialis]